MRRGRVVLVGSLLVIDAALAAPQVASERETAAATEVGNPGGGGRAVGRHDGSLLGRARFLRNRAGATPWPRP